ncbi:hypothetical protein SAMN06265376_10345 [Dokdonia pacifica]|uniref:Uncharacterized protein n=1 Tax=Dokdonia pacifica TaxID=1627892 RepID=A0A238Z8S1_9FLAO|nr:hypothetical protein SAMN06265376_10345 [Dokdonia pacifica]
MNKIKTAYNIMDDVILPSVVRTHPPSVNIYQVSLNDYEFDFKNMDMDNILKEQKFITYKI